MSIIQSEKKRSPVTFQKYLLKYLGIYRTFGISFILLNTFMNWTSVKKFWIISIVTIVTIVFLVFMF